MKHVLKRGLSLILVCMMVLALLPTAALAASWPKPTTYYNVYVYARFYDENGTELTASKLAELGYQGLDLNEDGWFTYGVINDAITTRPTYNASITNQDKLSQVTGQLNQVVRYTKDGQKVNASIEIDPNADGITYELKTADGATDYSASGYQWHLDCCISVSTLSKYTVHYYVKNTNTQVATDKVMSASIGAEVIETPVSVTGYTCDDGSKTITIHSTESENVITFYYRPNEYTVRYTWSGAPTGENAPTCPASQQVSYNASYTVDSSFSNNTVINDYDEYGNVNGKWTFSGWNKSGTITVTDNVEISGSWIYTSVDVSTHTVSYEWGTENVPSSASKPADATVTNNASYTVATVNDPVTTDDGTYTFDGWYSDEALTTKVTTLDKVTEDVTLYGKWTFAPNTYTVTYNKGEHGTLVNQDASGNVTHNSLKKGENIPKAPEVTAEDGYYFTGWYPELAETVTGDATYTAQYAEQTELVLSVADRTVEYSGTEQTGETEVTVANDYNLKEGHTLSVTDYTPAQGTNVVSVGNLYEGSFDDAVVKIMDEDGNDVTEQYNIISKTAGKLTITKKPITIHVTGSTKTVEYTGEEQFVFGFKPYATDVPTGTEVELDVATKAYANGTDAGKYNMGLAATDFKLTGDAAGNYEVTFDVTDGWLNIYKSDALTVSVTPIDVTYDGQPHEVEYAVTINGEPVEDADVTVIYSWGGETFGVPVDAGYYTATVTATKDNYETATGSATVTIRQREITVTADSASKTYDGTALTKNSWTITSGTLVEEHTADVTVTGSQTNVGSSNNVPSGAKITDDAGNDVTANYSVAYVKGTLTVTKANKPYVPPYTPPVTPVQPSRPTLNLNDHVAYIIGDDNGMVRPMANITRAEVATIFFRLMTDESRTEYWCTTNSFPDVADTAWYNNAVSTLANAGILLGRPDGTFGPQEYITRAEFAAIAARFSDVKYEGGYTFPDVPKTHWAYNDIGLAYQLGWVLGQPDGNFAPNRNITRAEAITLINRVLERDVEEEHLLPDMIKWPDNLPSAWYYEAIQEATNSHTYTRTDDQVPSQSFYYEDWYEIIENPDWVALERDWIAASGK